MFATTFPPAERRWLLTRPHIGPTVLDRLEQVGYGSIAHLCAAGPDTVVDAVCRELGNPAWGNRRRALARALHALQVDVPGAAPGAMPVTAMHASPLSGLSRATAPSV